MKKNTVKFRVIGMVIAVLFVLSAITAFTAIGTSAATVSPTAQTSETSHTAIGAARTENSYDWWYPWNWKYTYHPVI